MKGYIQLVNTETNEVIQQRVGFKNNIEYYEDKVWKTSEQVKVIFVTETDYAQPWKFLSPLLKNTEVKIFADVYDDMPLDSSPAWTGSAEELENMELSGFDVAGDCWTAYTANGTWVGTSEY